MLQKMRCSIIALTYSSEEGKKFQLESVKDVNYRTEQTLGSNNVENGHIYQYDKNGISFTSTQAV